MPNPVAGSEGRLVGGEPDATTVAATGEPKVRADTVLAAIADPKLDLGDPKPKGEAVEKEGENTAAAGDEVAAAVDTEEEEEEARGRLDFWTACSKASLKRAAISGVLKRTQNFSGRGSPSAKSWASQIQAVSFLGIGFSVMDEWRLWLAHTFSTCRHKTEEY